MIVGSVPLRGAGRSEGCLPALEAVLHVTYRRFRLLASTQSFARTGTQMSTTCESWLRLTLLIRFIQAHHCRVPADQASRAGPREQLPDESAEQFGVASVAALVSEACQVQLRQALDLDFIGSLDV